MTNAGGNIAAVVVAALPTATTNAVIGQPALGPWAWTNNLTDEDFTLGIGVKQGDLLGGKLELKGDLTYSQGKVSQTTAFVAPAGQNSGMTHALMSCGTLPDITNKMTRLNFAGDYKLDKQDKVAFGCAFFPKTGEQRLFGGMADQPATHRTLFCRPISSREAIT